MKIRRGATNDFITRADLDKMYNSGLVELKILDGELYATKPSTGCADKPLSKLFLYFFFNK